MKLVTTTEISARKLGDKEAVRLIKQAGFDAYDYNLCDMFRVEGNPLGGEKYVSHVKEVKALADDLGIPCLQAHAPFGYLPDKQAAEKSLKGAFRAIEIANIVGCPVLVVHPGNDFTAEQNYDYIYSRILPFAKQANVKIAAENMWNRGVDTYSVPAACGTAKDFAAHLDVADDPFLIACLDIGHAFMAPAPGAPELIRALGKHRLGALHVHDNDLIHDQHTFPFVGRIDWDSVILSLREIDYQGNFTFEADNYLAQFPVDLYPSCLKQLEKIGRYFIKRLTE